MRTVTKRVYKGMIHEEVYNKRGRRIEKRLTRESTGSLNSTYAWVFGGRILFSRVPRPLIGGRTSFKPCYSVTYWNRDKFTVFPRWAFRALWYILAFRKPQFKELLY